MRWHFVTIAVWGREHGPGLLLVQVERHLDIPGRRLRLAPDPGIIGGVIDLQSHDIEVHVVIADPGGPYPHLSWYRARFKDDPETEGVGPDQRQAIDDLYEVRKCRLEKAARPTEEPLSGFMRHLTALIDGVTKMGWQISGSPAILPDADGGGEVTLTLRLAKRRQVHVFAVDELF